MRGAGGRVTDHDALFVFGVHVSADHFAGFGRQRGRGVALFNLSLWPQHRFDEQLDRDTCADGGQLGSEDAAGVAHLVTGDATEVGGGVDFSAVGSVAAGFHLRTQGADIGLAVLGDPDAAIYRRVAQQAVERWIVAAGRAQDGAHSGRQFRADRGRPQGARQRCGAALLTQEGGDDQTRLGIVGGPTQQGTGLLRRLGQVDFTKRPQRGLLDLGRGIPDRFGDRIEGIHTAKLSERFDRCGTQFGRGIDVGEDLADPICQCASLPLSRQTDGVCADLHVLTY